MLNSPFTLVRQADVQFHRIDFVTFDKMDKLSATFILFLLMRYISAAPQEKAGGRLVTAKPNLSNEPVNPPSTNVISGAPLNGITPPEGMTHEEHQNMLKGAADFLYSYLPSRQNNEKLQMIMYSITDLRADIKKLKEELTEVQTKTGIRPPPPPPVQSSFLPFHFF